MTESWTIEDGPASVEALRARIDAGHLETWLTSSRGRSLAFVTNTERALVMLLDGDPGEHAVDPGASGTSEGFVLANGQHAVDPGASGTSKGFVLANGQHDEYPDADTVPIGEAFRIVEDILRSGSADAHWVVDR